MPSAFDLAYDDFVDDLKAIRSLVDVLSGPQHNPKTRVAAANSATLLLAATFEEFVREMAREYARVVVIKAESFDRLPLKLVSTAWKRTMDRLGRIKFDEIKQGLDVFGAANARFAVVYEFCKGDLSKEIYRDLIHNDKNMRPEQINELFNLSGLSNVCGACAGQQVVLNFIGEEDAGKAKGRFNLVLEGFFERRNKIAHSLNKGQSDGPEQIRADIELFESFAVALRNVVSAKQA